MTDPTQGYQPKPATVRAVEGGINQHYFEQGTGAHSVRVSSSRHTSFQFAEIAVLRFADVDFAQVGTEIHTSGGRTSSTIKLAAPQLRDLAHRLLDAAEDIDSNPAYYLAEAATA